MRSSHVLSSLFLLVLLTATLAAESLTLFTALDQNQDGWLQADEVDDQHHRLFDRLLRTADRDHDGRLSVGEFQAGLVPQQPAKPLVRKQGSEMPGADALLLLVALMDVNGDGRIVSGEVPGQFREIFDRIEARLGGDPDRDKQLSEQELIVELRRRLRRTEAKSPGKSDATMLPE